MDAQTEKLIRQAIVLKQITRSDGDALFRHKGHTKRHILYMLKLMVEQKTFREAHGLAMRTVGQ